MKPEERPLTAAYRGLFAALSDASTYRVTTVYDFYVTGEGRPDPNKINVVLRVDVDSGLHLAPPLASHLKQFGLAASFYFLSHPVRYYRLWGSGVPKRVGDLGHEVGLHTDHFFEELRLGTNGLEELRSDIARLAEEAGTPVRGMVYHGHEAMNALSKTNRDLYKNIPPEELGLAYHDGTGGAYIQPGSPTWRPKCDIRISDYLGLPRSWGWNYYPSFPQRALGNAQPGEVVHIAFHVKNAFEYWRGWTEEFGEPPLPEESGATFWEKKLRIYYRLHCKGLVRRAAKKALAVSARLLYLVCTPLLRKDRSLRAQSAEESEREHYYERGVAFYADELQRYGLEGFEKVLDVGSGNGRWLMAFSALGADAIGVEPRAEGVAQAEKHRKRLNAPRVTVLQGHAEALPVASESADLYFSYGVLMYCELGKALEEARRVLKPGGTYFIAVQGGGYPLIRMYHGLLARDYDQFSAKGFWRFITYLRNLVFPSGYERAADKSLPVGYLRKRLRNCGLFPEAVQHLDSYRAVSTACSLPVFYYVKGKKSALDGRRR